MAPVAMSTWWRIRRELVLALCLTFLISPTCEAATDLRSQGLTEFPATSLLPAAETQLYLDNNQLKFIPEGALCHMEALAELYMNNNQLTALANLTCIGATLRNLYVHSNQISSIPDDVFEGFVVLQKLHLYGNQLTAVPSMQHIQQSLLQINFGGNPLSGDFATSEIASLTQLTHLEMHSIGLQGFPVLPAKSTQYQLTLGSENLGVLVDDVLDLTMVPNLKVLQVTSASLTRIPIVNFTGVLSNLDLSQNKFIIWAPEDFERLPLTTGLKLYQCSLTTFPSFRYFALTLQTLNFDHNPITTIDPALIAELPKLTRLYLSYTDLMALDCPYGKLLNMLTLTRTPMTELPAVAHCTSYLQLLYGKISHVNYTQALRLGQLTSFYFYNTQELVELADYMDLSRANSYTLYVRSNTNLDLCRCDHVWMKLAAEAGAKIYFTDKVCGAGGEMWTELNSTQLLEQCDNSTLKAIDPSSSGGVWSISRENIASCQLPAHAYSDNIPQAECARLCLAHVGCTTFKFLNTGSGGSGYSTGSCQILVPTAPATVLTIPDQVNTNWKCFSPVPG